MSDRLKYWIVDENDELLLKPRKRVPYNEILKLLMEGYEIFIECDRKMAHYYKKQFEKRLKSEISTYPAIYKKMHGYIFRLSIMNVLFNRESDEPEQADQY